MAQTKAKAKTGETIDAEFTEVKHGKQVKAAKKPATKTPGTALQIAPEPTPANMLQTAIEKNLSPESLKMYMDLHDRWRAGLARDAYTKAMTDFKKNPPRILKNKHVKYPVKDKPNEFVEYSHAKLSEITAAIILGLSQHGMSHRWTVKQEQGGVIEVSCEITHVEGHKESVSLKSTPDQTGGKNSIQSVSSAVTYLQRYTLLLATGLAPEEMTKDDDGRAAGERDQAPPVEKITEAQAKELLEMAKAKKLNPDRICGVYFVKFLRDIPADKYEEVKDRIKSATKPQPKGREPGEEG